jgi:hypothetical protein
VVCGCLTIGFFLFLAVYLFAPCPGDPEDRLEEYEGQFGSLYNNLKYKQTLWSLGLIVIFIVKRVIFAIGVFYFPYR